MKRPYLNLSGDELDNAIIALIEMPPYETYLNEFGSWLGALTESGIIEGQGNRTGRGFRCIALDGHECYSLSEKCVDDWMTQNNVLHEKEVLYPFDKELNPYGMRADWKVKESYIEFAGLLTEPAYAERMNKKKALAEKNDIEIIILTLEDIPILDEIIGQFRNDIIVY